MFKYFCLPLLAFVCGAAHAGDFSGCTVGQIVTVGDQNVHVSLVCPTPITALPACATAASYVGFDGSTPSGKRFFSLFSLALAMNWKLDGSTDSICSPYQSNVALLTVLRASK